SYWRVQFIPQGVGSVVSSVTSSSRRLGFFASCFRLEMLVSNAATTNATAAKPPTTASVTATRRRLAGFDEVFVSAMRSSPVLSARAVPDAAVAMNTAPVFHLGGLRPARAGDQRLVNQVAVTAKAIVLQDLRVPRLDQDRLVEVLQREPLRVVVTVQRLREVLLDGVA